MSKKITLWKQDWTLPDARTYYQKQFSDLKGNKKNISVKCCFHDEETPSLSLQMETGQFKCHAGSCGVSGGDIMDFHMLRYGYGKPTVNMMREMGATSSKTGGVKKAPIQPTPSQVDEINRILADATLDDDEPDDETPDLRRADEPTSPQKEKVGATPPPETTTPPVKCRYVEGQRLMVLRDGMDFPVEFLSLQAEGVANVRLEDATLNPDGISSTAFLSELSINQQAKYDRIKELSQNLPWASSDFGVALKELMASKPAWLKADDGSLLCDWDLTYATQSLDGYKEGLDIRQVRWDKFGKSKCIRVLKWYEGAFSFAGKDSSGAETADKDEEAVVLAYPRLPELGKTHHIIWLEGYRKADLANAFIAPIINNNPKHQTYFMATPSASTLPDTFDGLGAFKNHAWLDNDKASEAWLERLQKNLKIQTVFQDTEGAEGNDVVDLLGEMPSDYADYTKRMMSHNKALTVKADATTATSSSASTSGASTGGDEDDDAWIELYSSKTPASVILPPSDAIDIHKFHPIVQAVCVAMRSDVPIPYVMTKERLDVLFSSHSSHLIELDVSLQFRVSTNDYYCNVATTSGFKSFVRKHTQEGLEEKMALEATNLAKQIAWVKSENEKQAKYIKQLKDDAEEADLALRDAVNDLEVQEAKLMGIVGLEDGETKSDVREKMVEIKGTVKEQEKNLKTYESRLTLAEAQMFLPPKNRIVLSDMSSATLQAMDQHINTVNATALIENDDMNAFWGGYSFKGEQRLETVGTLCSRWEFGYAKGRDRMNEDIASKKVKGCVSLMLAGQPSSLATVMAKIENFVSSGLFGRFNFSVNGDFEFQNKQIEEMVPVGLEKHLNEYYRVLMCAWRTADNVYTSDHILPSKRKDFHAREFAWAPDGGVKAYHCISLWTDLEIRRKFITATNRYLKSMNFFGENKKELNGKVVDKCGRALLRIATFRHTAEWVSDRRMTYIQECLTYWRGVASGVSSLLADIFNDLYDTETIQAMEAVNNQKMHLAYLCLMHFTDFDLDGAFTETEFYAKERVRVAHNVMAHDASKSTRFLIALVQAHLDGKELEVQANKQKQGRTYEVVKNFVRTSTLKDRCKAGLGDDLLQMISLNPSFVKTDPLLADLVRFKTYEGASQRGFSGYQLHPDINQEWLNAFVNEVNLRLGLLPK